MLITFGRLCNAKSTKMFNSSLPLVKRADEHKAVYMYGYGTALAQKKPPRETVRGFVVHRHRQDTEITNVVYLESIADLL